MLLEFLKARSALALPDNAYFWRTSEGVEVDFLFDLGPTCLPVECKSGMTIASDWTRSLEKFSAWAGDAAETPVVVYGGEENRTTSRAVITPWKRIGDWTGFRRNGAG